MNNFKSINSKNQEEYIFSENKLKLLEEENSRLKKENQMFLETIEGNQKQLNNLPKDVGVIKKLQEQLRYKDTQIIQLEESVENKNKTIRSLQENMLESQVHKIPQYQKTILFLNESVKQLQVENEKLKELLKQKGIDIDR